MIDLEISKGLGRVFRAIEHVTDAAGVAITTATVSLRLIRESDGFVFDWSDKTFKNAGHTTPDLAASHLGDGAYRMQSSMQQTGGGIDMTDGQLLRARISVALPSTATYYQFREYQCTQKSYAAASISNRHRVDETPNPNQDVVYAINGTTEIGRHDLTDTSSNSVSNLTAGQLAQRGGNVL